MSEATLKSYGEAHGEDGLLTGILGVMIEAAESGCRKCFVEQPPKLQSDRDQYAHRIAQAALDPQTVLARDLAAYDSSPTNSYARMHIRERFIMNICTFSGIRVICADVSDRDPMIEYRAKFIELSSARRYTVGEMAQALGCQANEAMAMYTRLNGEMRDGTFLEELRREKSARLSQDPEVAKFMLSQMDGGPAIAFYGDDHLDFDRPSSLASVLHDEMGSRFGVYRFSQGQIVQSQSPVRNSFNHGSPKADITPL